MLDEKSVNGYREISITKFLWLIQDGIETVSNDRLLRFNTAVKKDWEVTPLAPYEVLAIRSFISIGEIITIIDAELNTYFIGQIACFKTTTEGRKKSDRRFGYDAVFFNENKSVEFLLYPMAKVLSSTQLEAKENRDKYYSASSYINTINSQFVNFEQSLLHPNVFNFFTFGIQE